MGTIDIPSMETQLSRQRAVSTMLAQALEALVTSVRKPPIGPRREAFERAEQALAEFRQIWSGEL